MTSLAERLARPEILALEPFDIAAQANSAFGPDAIVQAIAHDQEFDESIAAEAARRALVAARN